MLRFLTLALLFCAGTATAQTRQSLLDDGFQPITCRFSERCAMGYDCRAQVKVIEILYSGEFRMMFVDNAGAGMTIASPISRPADPYFLALLNDGKDGMLTIHKRGFALLSQHSGDTSPPGGVFLRGTCDPPKS